MAMNRIYAGFMAVLVLVASAAMAADQPNVILIMTDDQGYGDVAAHGNSMIRTPNMDALHGQSVRLTNFHVDPTCSPTRSALMSGRYSTRTGVWHTIAGRSIMARDEVTIAQMFKDAGYTTGIFGKWHLGDNYPYRPQDRGFDQAVIHGGGGVQQTPDFWGNDYFDDIYWHNGRPRKFTGYCTDVFFRTAISFIRRNQDKPFFCYIPTNAPHGPFYVDPKYAEPYEKAGVGQPMANFYGMITNIDENLGTLMRRLERWGLAENTILIFMTDNGTAAGYRPAGGRRGKRAQSESAWEGFNAGMRGTKGSEYDGGHRVPFFVRWPAAGIGGGRDIDTLSAHVDVMPTLADLCGIKIPKSPAGPINGRSLAPLLKGTIGVNWPDRTLLVHSQRIQHPEKWRKCSVMTQRWRLVNGEELYDMQADPGQTKDVAKQNDGVVADLRREYEAWWKSISTRFDDYVPIVIGAAAANPALITAHDWIPDERDNVPWNHPSIERAPQANGHWEIDVERAGRYEFILRQQPTEAKHAIEGAMARLKIADVEETQPIPAGATGVSFIVNLPAGRTKLQTWFADERSGVDRGAFFIYARFIR